MDAATESATRQYALRENAIALGWPAEAIVTIDTDQGQSGASDADREGFQRPVAEVSMGRAGIVQGLEVSRLARNNADWHRPLQICAMSATLICDEDGLYDPNDFNDRLLLGLKGTMSEALWRIRHKASYADPTVMPTGWVGSWWRALSALGVRHNHSPSRKVKPPGSGGGRACPWVRPAR